ncbi:MAG: hypothetical protein Q9162_007004 [Coniocarpon cinnabarinum]
MLGYSKDFSFEHGGSLYVLRFVDPNDEADIEKALELYSDALAHGEETRELNDVEKKKHCDDFFDACFKGARTIEWPPGYKLVKTVKGSEPGKTAGKANEVTVGMHLITWQPTDDVRFPEIRFTMSSKVVTEILGKFQHHWIAWGILLDDHMRKEGLGATFLDMTLNKCMRDRDEVCPVVVYDCDERDHELYENSGFQRSKKTPLLSLKALEKIKE